MKVLDANLKTKIISHIKDNGPINLSSFMAMCIHDKQFGYYSNSNVIGKNGDFITAPEVSQVFGELIAANIIDNQIKSNFFKANIVDLGPGKGTLISDILSPLNPIFSQNLTSSSHINFASFNAASNNSSDLTNDNLLFIL